MLIYSKEAPAVVLSTLKRVMARNYPEIVTVGGDLQVWIRDGMVRERVMAILSGFFGVLAVLLAMIGLYGVISYLVASRPNEIGVRLALGAGRWKVIGVVMRDAWTMLAIGIAIGMTLSLIAGHWATSLLFNLKSHDPFTFAIAGVLLIAICLLASFLPARRASNLDPMLALRYE